MLVLLVHLYFYYIYYIYICLYTCILMVLAFFTYTRTAYTHTAYTVLGLHYVFCINNKYCNLLYNYMRYLLFLYIKSISFVI